MKTIIFAWLTYAFLTLSGNAPAQGVAAAPPTQPFTGEETEKVAEGEVSAAAAQGRTDLMLAALQTGSDIQMFCIDKIATLPRVAQAQFIATASLDGKVLVRGDESSDINLGAQDSMQRRLVEMAYLLLEKPMPAFHGILTRAEANALAVQLKSLSAYPKTHAAFLTPLPGLVRRGSIPGAYAPG